MKIEFLIAPEEAFDLCGRIQSSEIEQAVNVASAYRANAHEIWGDILLYATVYHAGRVDGIRQERARYKRKDGTSNEK